MGRVACFTALFAIETPEKKFFVHQTNNFKPKVRHWPRYAQCPSGRRLNYCFGEFCLIIVVRKVLMKSSEHLQVPFPYSNQAFEQLKVNFEGVFFALTMRVQRSEIVVQVSSVKDTKLFF